jgi:hypothetical protein
MPKHPLPFETHEWTKTTTYVNKIFINHFVKSHLLHSVWV